MPTPYRSEEIAEALIVAARRDGRPFRRIEVISDDAAGSWRIRVTGEDGRTEQLELPFATARGICTPAEIADHLVRGDWPFG